MVLLFIVNNLFKRGEMYRNRLKVTTYDKLKSRLSLTNKRIFKMLQAKMTSERIFYDF